MSATEEEKKVGEEGEEKNKGGELLFCGSTCWDIVGRRKGAVEGNLISPTRLRPLVGVEIRFVASGGGEFIAFCFTPTHIHVKASFFFLFFFSNISSLQHHVIALHWMLKGDATRGVAMRYEKTKLFSDVFVKCTWLMLF